MKKYDLKKRIYLGPTSLDHGLAFIMTTIGQVSQGSTVLDPFVGTASILVASSHFGAHCFGTDIDMRVLKGQMHAGVQVDRVGKDSPATSDGVKAKKKGQYALPSDTTIWSNFR